MESVPHDQELIDALKDHLDSPEDGKEDDPNNWESVTTHSDNNQPDIELPEPNLNIDSDNRPSTNEMTQGDFQPPEILSNEAIETISPEDLHPDNMDLSSVWRSVEIMVERKQFKDALAALTRFYNDPNLNSKEEEKLHGWLDALAGKVIYSMEHLMVGSPHVVRPNESIVDIASQWKVTPQLVYNVNKTLIQNPSNLEPGTKLKSIRGPFHAEVNLSDSVLTVFVDNLYAGRFSVMVDRNSNMEPGRYSITGKSANLQDANRQNGSNQEPAAYWMGMEGGFCMQAATETAGLQKNCIGLRPGDAADLFSIFTENSKIFIR